MNPARVQQILQQGLAQHQAGRVQAAAALYAQLRKLAPRSFEAHHLGGAAALQLAQPAEAEKLLARAIALNPRSPTTYMCLGLAQGSLGHNLEAIKNLRRSVELDANNYEAWGHLGSLLTIDGKLEDAATSYRKSIALKPVYAQAWSGLGSVLQLLSRSQEAITHQTRAIELDPQHPKARFCRAQAYFSMHCLDEALADFDAQLARFPDDLEARSYRLFILNYSSEVSREKLFAEHRIFGTAAAKTKPLRPQLARPPIEPNESKKKISVAFLSPDLRTHSVAYFLEPLLHHLDRERFEITLYHDHFCTDDTSARLRALAVRWRNFIGLAADIVESMIREDAPDILIDLAGHTGFNRLPLYAHRLAPLQITYLGYPGTTGLAEMDYRFTDEIADPPGESDAFHSERLVRFAPTAWSYAPPTCAPEPAQLGGQAGQPITFGSFNNISKLSFQTLRLWAAVLNAVPGSRLLLKSSGLCEEMIAPRLLAAGLDRSRIELLAATTTIAEHLALYQRIDVALDPLPYNGTTTTCEALWMGVPVVTLLGDRHAARVGASLLTAIGHPEWIALSDNDYIRISAELANNTAKRTALRLSLRDDLRRSPLLDHVGQAARFGEALHQCWKTNSRA
ncbi:MAG: tetratricopeptide repeat protein [Verrucomicrobia bacterium]|nr:tetratricopeptide repeat protein [Verrucomicrobiota bacterium]